MASLRWIAPFSVALSLVAVRPAAASLVLAKSDGDVHASEARVAFSTGASRTVAWEQLVLDEARGEIAWVVAVPKGGWVEAADDHFFHALDEGTAPVIAPAKMLGCPPASRESTAAPRPVLPARPIGGVLGPMSSALAITRLGELGFVVGAGARAALIALDAAGEEVAILTLPSGPRGETKTVRVLGPVGRPFPSILAPTNGPAARLHAWIVSAARAHLTGVPAVEIDSARLSWAEGKSNFTALLDDSIGAAAPGVVVTFAGADGLFVDQPGGAALTTVPSVTRQYFGAWDSGGYPAAVACASRVVGLAGSAKLVAPTCAKKPPWPTSLAAPACSLVGADEIAPSELTCYSLDDLAAAAGGLAPSRTWLTRLEGVALPTTKAPPIDLVSLGSIPSFREARLGAWCSSSGSTTPPPSGGAPADDAGGGDPSSEEPGAYAPSSSSSSGDACGGTIAVVDACSRSSSGSGGGCGGDSSSSGDGCGGDSSSSGDGCSGDSGDSSDGCSGASSSSDDGCSSSSSSGSSGSCGGAASSADDGCLMGQRVSKKRARLRVSAWSYAAIAIAAVARRFGRRKSDSRAPTREPDRV
ncbi:MAG: hypothetical protein HYV09_17700 [Deltaproteobacteria bacterium]|nr:hypothetical protein [Deltaproteobacteria bacterium]